MKNNARVPVATSKTRGPIGWPVSQAGDTLGLAGGAAALSLALLIGCAGSSAKRVPPEGEGGGAGAAAEAEPSANKAGSSSVAGNGGVGVVEEPGQGDAGEGVMVDTSATGGSVGASGGAASGGDGPGTEGGAGPAGAAGADSAPAIPVSVCGPGRWFAGEGLCAECPEAQQVFELDCGDYVGGVVLTTTAGQLQSASASLPGGVQAHEASPVELSVTYLEPSESHPRLLRLNTSGWSVDLRQAPVPPEAIIVPPFSTADVCGNVFHSRQPMRFDRVVEEGVTSYDKVCP